MIAVLILSAQLAFSADETVGVNEVSTSLIIFSTSTGNVVASVGADGVVLVGMPSAASTAEIEKILASRTKSTIRYVVIWPEDLAHSQGDAGWGRAGAFVAMHENALKRLGGHVMGVPQPFPANLIALKTDRPRIAFSEVLGFDVNGEAVHVIHQKPGYSDADALAHFHLAKLVYMGEAFPGDGYPMIDAAQGGTLDGLLDTIQPWTDPTFKVVPARGPLTNGTTVKSFHDMIITVRDRVERLMKEGRSESAVIAQHPTSEFDATWGHGRVPPDDFVREVYTALKKK